MSKPKQFCETSSIFWTWQHQKRSNSARLQKWKVECRAGGLVPMRFAFLPVHPSKVFCLPRKSEARSYEVPHLSRKTISANLMIWCSKMQPLSGNQRPDLLTSLINMSLVLRLPRKLHCRSSLQMSHACHRFWKCHRALTFCSLLSRCTIPALATRNDIWTSKSAPMLVCFVHFDFEMCFAPQQCALFRHLNFQKWSDAGVLCTFWLRNVLHTSSLKIPLRKGRAYLLYQACLLYQNAPSPLGCSHDFLYPVNFG